MGNNNYSCINITCTCPFVNELPQKGKYIKGEAHCGNHQHYGIKYLELSFPIILQIV